MNSEEATKKAREIVECSTELGIDDKYRITERMLIPRIAQALLEASERERVLRKALEDIGQPLDYGWNNSFNRGDRIRRELLCEEGRREIFFRLGEGSHS